MKTKYGRYYVWLLSGVLCFILFLKLLPIPQWSLILIEIISILAGGVFGSTVVAIFIEIINDKYQKEKILIQKKLLLTDLNSCLQCLIKNETRAINNAWFISNSCTNVCMEKRQKNISTLESIDYIINILQNFNSSTMKYTKDLVIDVDYLQRLKIFEQSMFESSFNYYKNLNNYYNKIVTNKEYYILNEILTQQDIEMLISTFVVVDDIIKYSKGKSLDFISEIKILFFEELKSFIKHFNLNIYFGSLVYKYNLYEEIK